MATCLSGQDMESYVTGSATPVQVAAWIHNHTPTRTIGHFELLNQISMGIFWTVWMARDTELDRFQARPMWGISDQAKSGDRL